MSAAGEIYDACLRAELKLETEVDELDGEPRRMHLAALLAVIAIREEIGNGLAHPLLSVSPSLEVER